MILKRILIIAYLLFTFLTLWGSAYRDPKLAALSPEELASLDALTKKLSLPSPDASQNQIESKPAMEATDVDSEA